MTANTLVGEDLWQAVRPLLPPELPKPKGGRPQVPDRAALAGIIYVLKTGIPWGMLPREMGCGSRSNVLAKAERLAEGRRLAKAVESSA